MIKVLKYLIAKIVEAFGYKLIRSSTVPVRFDNFTNLATAYEARLSDSGSLVLPNELRRKLLARLLGTPPSEAYFIIEALAECRSISGDVCEFGVAQGETSALIANEITPCEGKSLHLFDSFEGLPEPTEMDRLKDDIFSLGTMGAYKGTMACPEDMVRARLSEILFPDERVVVHKGFIDRVISESTTLPSEVCFAYVDFDFYDPIRITLDYLHRVTAIGSIIIVDDYDFFSTGVKLAVDNFIEAHSAGEIIYECLVPNVCYGHFAVIRKIA